jgi:hypothetical protein
MKRVYVAKYLDLTELTIAMALFVTGVASAAETGRPIPLRLAYSAITFNQAIPWISYEAGHFKKIRA